MRFKEGFIKGLGLSDISMIELRESSGISDSLDKAIYSSFIDEGDFF